MPEKFNKLLGQKTKGSEDRVSKDPLLAGRRETAATTEAVPEPVEVQVPPAAKPTKKRNEQAAVADLPDRPRENQVITPEFGRNLVLVLFQPLGVFLAKVGIELESDPANHLLSVHPVLPVLVERDTGDGSGDTPWDVLQKGPVVLPLVVAEVAGDGSEAALDGRLEMDLELKRIERVAVRLPQLAPNLEQLARDTLIQIACDQKIGHDDIS